METIYKYNLEVIDRQIIQMPEQSEILTVQSQFNEPKLWVKVESDNKKIDYEIAMFGTGYPILDDYNGVYIGTIQLDYGNYVYHCFYKEIC